MPDGNASGLHKPTEVCQNDDRIHEDSGEHNNGKRPVEAPPNGNTAIDPKGLTTPSIGGDSGNGGPQTLPSLQAATIIGVSAEATQPQQRTPRQGNGSVMRRTPKFATAFSKSSTSLKVNDRKEMCDNESKVKHKESEEQNSFIEEVEMKEDDDSPAAVTSKVRPSTPADNALDSKDLTPSEHSGISVKSTVECKEDVDDILVRERHERTSVRNVKKQLKMATKASKLAQNQDRQDRKPAKIAAKASKVATKKLSRQDKKDNAGFDNKAWRAKQAKKQAIQEERTKRALEELKRAEEQAKAIQDRKAKVAGEMSKRAEKQATRTKKQLKKAKNDGKRAAKKQTRQDMKVLQACDVQVISDEAKKWVEMSTNSCTKSCKYKAYNGKKPKRYERVKGAAKKMGQAQRRAQLEEYCYDLTHFVDKSTSVSSVACLRETRDNQDVAAKVTVIEEDSTEESRTGTWFMAPVRRVVAWFKGTK
jgi:hypothetical protein